MIPGPRRHLSADLAIRSDEDDVLLAAEFKFEPAHRRLDLLSHKFPDRWQRLGVSTLTPGDAARTC